MKDLNIALLILTQNKFYGELNLTINRLNELEFNRHFHCYLACKNINNEKFNFLNWTSINVPKNCNTWGSEFTHSLDSIEEEYIFVFLDDFYLFKKISALKLKEKVISSLDFNPSLIRINSNFNSRIFLKKKKSNIYLETYNHRYSTSLVMPIFKKEFLKQILFKSDSPWSFEKQSNKRFSFRDHNFVFIKGIDLNLNLINIAVKGYSLRTSLNRIPKSKKQNYLKISKLKKMSLLNEIKFHLKKIIFDIFMKYWPHF